MLLVIIISLSILVIGLLVFVHEFGHFIVAKKSGILVQEFAFGFGPILFARRKGDTLYRINLFPFGGYVKMLGDLDGSSLTRLGQEILNTKEQDFIHQLLKQNKFPQTDYIKFEEFYNSQKTILSKTEYEILTKYFYHVYIPTHPGNFENAKSLSKVAVIVAGVVMNTLLGIVLFCIYFAINNNYTYLNKIGNPTFIGAQVSNPPIIWYSAESKSLTESFVIEANGVLIKDLDQFRAIIANNYNKPINITASNFRSGDIVQTDVILDGEGIKSNYDQDYQNRVIITAVIADGLADRTNIKAGSIIQSVNGIEVYTIDNFKAILSENRGKTIVFKYLDQDFNPQTLDLILPNVADDEPILSVSLADTNSMENSASNILRVDYSQNNLFISAIFHSYNVLVYNASAPIELVKKAFTEKKIEVVSNNITSVLILPDIFKSLISSYNYAEIINITAIFSLTLAMMNILPIPLFDGGHLLFMLIEKIRGKKLSAKTQDIVGQVFFYLLITFTIIIVIKDFFQFNWLTRLWVYFSGMFS